MLEQPAVDTTHDRAAPALGAIRRSRAAAVITAVIAAGVVCAYALPGGSYATVVRQEYGLVLWVFVAVGWATGVLPRSRPAGATLGLLCLLALYAVWTAVSLLWTDSPERTFAEIARIAAYGGLVAAVASLLGRENWRSAAFGLSVGAWVICALAVASRLNPGAFPVAAQLHGITARLSYPFGYWNAVGTWGAMSAAIGLAWSAHDAARWRRSLALAAVPIALVCTYLSYSRGGAAGVLVGALAVLVLSQHRLTASVHALAAAALAAVSILVVRAAPEIAHANGTVGSGRVGAVLVGAAVLCAAVAYLTGTVGIDRRRMPRRAAWLLAVPVVMVIAAAGAGFGPHAVSRAWRQFRHPATAQTSDPAARLTQLSGTRYQVWKSALRAFDAHPLDGTGAGTFAFWWDRNGTTSESVRNAHSFELENLAELGIPGLLVILGVMGAAVAVAAMSWRGSRRRFTRAASAAMLAAWPAYLLAGSVDWMWQVTAVTALALAASVIAGARLAQARPPSLPAAMRIAVTVLALAGCAVELPGLLATRAISRSQAAARRNDLPVALGWANSAVGDEPWSASAYEQRALVYEAAGELQRAAPDLEQAIADEPANFRHWLLLARVRTEQGNFRGADAALARAERLRPHGVVFALAPYLGTVNRRQR